MEQDHRGAAVLEQAEVQEWVDLAVEGWAVREQVQALEGDVYVQNAERLFLMKSEHPVTL